MMRQRSWRAGSFLRGRAGNKSPRHHISHAPHHRRLRVEPLEDRRLLAVFTVDNLNDAGTGSLRQAIDDANAAVGADTVVFQAGLAGTIALSTGEMLITDDLTIDGPGAAALTIDAQQNSRIFHITPASGPVTIDGLHLTGGETGIGGAILAFSDVEVIDSTISGNSATFGSSGGGIAATGDVTVTGSTISDNSATNIGGGIYALGDVMITSSTISGNLAVKSGSQPLGGGGGVHSGGAVTVTDSTITDNSATARFARGGGIFADREVTVTGSTISGNTATGMGDFGSANASGGGIYSDGSVTITGSTISGNSATGGLSVDGGGIRASGNVTITSSTISENSAMGEFAFGGAIWADSAVTVTRSTISGNSATGVYAADGGGIKTRSDVTVSGSTISGNSAASIGTFGQPKGGGIFAGSVTMTDSTISGNSATGFRARGGGVYAGDLTVATSTISGNAATGDSAGYGGGILAFGDLTVTNSTISGNWATGDSRAQGGGIWVRNDPVTIENSIVAGNHTNDGDAPDLRPGSGPLTVRYSLIGDNTSTGLAPAPVGMPDANGNLIGTAASPIDPLLGPLQDNGGPTLTHALLPGSPAINAGDPTFAPPPDFDQRGDPFVRVSDGRIDMGAFELQPVSLDQRIQQLLDDGVLNRGQANSLLVKLNPAGNERAQINRLSALINEVNALIRAGILSAAEGQALIDGAESLQMSLSVDAVLSLAVGRG